MQACVASSARVAVVSVVKSVVCEVDGGVAAAYDCGRAVFGGCSFYEA